MKFALIAVVASFSTAGFFGTATGTQAAAFHAPAKTEAVASPGGCPGGVIRAADLLGTPAPCCNRALGCAQFLATTRVARHAIKPRT